MNKVWACNATVTTFQLITVAIAYLFFSATLSQIALTATITAAIIAFVGAVKLDGRSPEEEYRLAQVGFAGYSATFVAAGMWLYFEGRDLLSISSFVLGLFLADLFAKKAKQQWAKEPHRYLFVNAIPTAGVILGLFAIIYKTTKEFMKED